MIISILLIPALKAFLLYLHIYNTYEFIEKTKVKENANSNIKIIVNFDI